MGNGRHSGLPKGVRSTGKANGYRIYKTIDDIDAAHGKVTERFERNVKGTDMQSSIYYYSGDGYQYTNPVVRDKRYAEMTTEEMFRDLRARVDSGEVTEHIYEKAYNIHKGLSLGESAEAFVGYRGAGYSLIGLTRNSSFSEVKALEGQLVRDTGNMSISMIKGREFRSKPVLYEVHVPAGKGIGANIMGISKYGKAEGEFLFNNGAVYRVKKVTKTRSGKPHIILEYEGRS